MERSSGWVVRGSPCWEGTARSAHEAWRRRALPSACCTLRPFPFARPCLRDEPSAFCDDAEQTRRTAKELLGASQASRQLPAGVSGPLSRRRRRSGFRRGGRCGTRPRRGPEAVGEVVDLVRGRGDVGVRRRPSRMGLCRRGSSGRRRRRWVVRRSDGGGDVADCRGRRQRDRGLSTAEQVRP